MNEQRSDKIKTALEAIERLEEVALAASSLVEKGHYVKWDLESTIPNFVTQLQRNLKATLAKLTQGEQVDAFGVLFHAGGTFAKMREMEGHLAPAFERSREFQHAWRDAGRKLHAVFDIHPL